MTRTTPDPVFAAAAQSELERRVRAAAPGGAGASMRSAPRRGWLVELGATTGIVLLAAGVFAGFTALRPVFEAGGAPASAIMGSPEPSAPGDDVTAVPTPAPSDAGTPTPDLPTATELPPSAPVTPPPAPEPTTQPTADPAALVGADGARVRSEAEVRAWADGLGYGSVWTEQQVLDVRCMAEHGFRLDPEFERSAGLAARRQGMTDAQWQAFQDALYGPPTDAPYDWRTAGCHGRSVHETGQDGNH